MQPLIQDILSQIIDSSPCCPERFCDFSCMRFPFKTKQKVLSHEIVFGHIFTRNAKNGSECLKLIWSGTFAICSTQPLWLWSRIGSRVKISHYIQPSNLSSALNATHFLQNHWLLFVLFTKVLWCDFSCKSCTWNQNKYFFLCK